MKRARIIMFALALVAVAVLLNDALGVESYTKKDKKPKDKKPTNTGPEKSTGGNNPKKTTVTLTTPKKTTVTLTTPKKTTVTTLTTPKKTTVTTGANNPKKTTVKLQAQPLTIPKPSAMGTVGMSWSSYNAKYDPLRAQEAKQVQKQLAAIKNGVAFGVPYVSSPSTNNKPPNNPPKASSLNPPAPNVPIVPVAAPRLDPNKSWAQNLAPGTAYQVQAKKYWDYNMVNIVNSFGGTVTDAATGKTFKVVDGVVKGYVNGVEIPYQKGTIALDAPYDGGGFWSDSPENAAQMKNSVPGRALIPIIPKDGGPTGYVLEPTLDAQGRPAVSTSLINGRFYSNYD